MMDDVVMGWVGGGRVRAYGTHGVGDDLDIEDGHV